MPAAAAGLAWAATASWFYFVVLVATSDAQAVVADVQASTPARWCPRQPGRAAMITQNKSCPGRPGDPHPARFSG